MLDKSQVDFTLTIIIFILNIACYFGIIFLLNSVFLLIRWKAVFNYFNEQINNGIIDERKKYRYMINCNNIGSTLWIYTIKTLLALLALPVFMIMFSSILNWYMIVIISVVLIFLMKRIAYKKCDIAAHNRYPDEFPDKIKY